MQKASKLKTSCIAPEEYLIALEMFLFISLLKAFIEASEK